MKYEQLFADSYDRVLSVSKNDISFFEDFYERFSASSDEVAKKFENIDMEKQRRIVEVSLHHMLACYKERQINFEIVKIAVRHNKANLDISPELYDLWLECLIKSVKKYDYEFDAHVELSWRIVLSIGITYMKYRYNNWIAV